MRIRRWIFVVVAMPSLAISSFAIENQGISPVDASSFGTERPLAISDVYIEQAHGRVSQKDTFDAKVLVKPTPEAIGNSNTGEQVPDTCNSQNASSQACYTATQQARPATR
jgi:hypothetical protein